MTDFAESKPLITIAIPTCNRASLLRGCIDSVLSQSYEKFEILVCDNASTDRTTEMLSEIDDPRLRVVRHEQNIGLMPNWNACITEARGDFIVFVPDDDRIAPWMLERCTDLLARDPSLVGVVALNDLHLLKDGRRLGPAQSRILPTGIHEGSDILLEYLRGHLSVQMCSLVISTRLLRRIGGFANDWPYAGDTAAWSRIMLMGRAGLVNESCATFAWHDESATSKYPISNRRDSGRRFIATLDTAIDYHVADPVLRTNIKREVRRYIARDMMAAITSCRKSGVSLARMLPRIWQCRREIAHSRMAVGASEFTRFVAIILLPGFVSGMVGRIGQSLRGRACRGSEDYRPNA